jgi:hypothetical protein
VKIVLILLVLEWSLFAIAADKSMPMPLKKNEVAGNSEPKPMVLVESPKEAPKVLAEIDPKTLKVTYKKGVDPKEVVDEVLKIWAMALRDLRQCQDDIKKVAPK